MGTTAEKINRLTQTKSDLKTVINYTGANITEETTFKEYPKLLNKAYIDILNNGTDDLYEALPKTTATGSNLDLDTEEGKMKLIPKAVQIEQLNTPTVENPQNIYITTGINNIKLQNKNLFNYRDTTNVTSGIVVDDDGWITVSYDNSSGSSTKYFNYYTHNLNLKTDTDYKIFLEVKNVSGTGRVYFCSTGVMSQMKNSYNKEFNTISSNNVYSQIAKTKTSFTGTNDGIRIFLQFAAGQSGSITFRHSVLEDTSLSVNDFIYTPYQEQNYPIALSSKNLFDFANISVSRLGSYGTITVENNEIKFTATGQTIYGVTIDLSGLNLKNNTTYTVSDLYNITTSQYVSGWRYYNGSSYTPLNNYREYFTFTTTESGVNQILFYVGSPATLDGTLTLYNIQLLEGNIARTDIPTYAPYIANPLEYCKIGDYADHLFKNTKDSEFYDSTLLENEWYLKKNITKHLFDGDINKDTYNFSTDLTNVLAINLLPDNIDIPLIKPRNTYALYSDKFTYISNVNNIEHIYISQPITTSTGWMGNIRLYINHDRLEGYSSSLTNEQKRDLVINWLQQNPLPTYYIARYPETIHISQTDYPILRSQLEDLYNNAKSYEDKTYITITNNNEENLLLEVETSALAKIE